MNARIIVNYCLGLMMLQPVLTNAADTGAEQSAASLPTTGAIGRVDITTESGITYQDCKITRVEPNGISVSHAKGIAKIPFTDLPEEFRTRYNYSPTNAAAYTRSIEKQREEAAAAAIRAADATAKRAALAETNAPQSGVQAPKGGEEEIPKGKGLIAAEAIQGMVKQMGESQAQFEARRKAAVDEALRKNGQQ